MPLTGETCVVVMALITLVPFHLTVITIIQYFLSRYNIINMMMKSATEDIYVMSTVILT